MELIVYFYLSIGVLILLIGVLVGILVSRLLIKDRIDHTKGYTYTLRSLEEFDKKGKYV